MYRRYQTYARNYGDNRLYKIAGGANIDDYNWTETLMERASSLMDGLSLHYYTIPGDFWKGKGSSLQFSEQEWFITMQKALYMDELITKHSTIMDKYDPEKRVSLIIDEWGTWFDVEPGTNPGFLYQQNSIRDAIVAALHFHIFHQHCDRVHMANIAQTVNVLQAMVLTEGEKMLKTPTYYIFDMFKVHQDAALLSLETDIENIAVEDFHLPKISVSASKNDSGQIHISLCNMSLSEKTDVNIQLRGVNKIAEISGEILTADYRNAHNSFENPEAVKPENFTEFTLIDHFIEVNLPPMSIIMLSVKE